MGVNLYNWVIICSRVWVCNVFILYIMLLVGEIILIAIVAYVIVVIVEMVTKKWIAYLIVLFCLMCYAGAILAFQSGPDQHDPQHHDHTRCK